MGENVKPHAIVIGSGFGGLAAACRLLSQGYKTTLLEKRAECGGRAYVYKEKGYIFDAGPTVITAPYLFEEIFALFQEKMPVELLAIEPFYELTWSDGYTFYYSNDNERLRRQILKKNPKDWENYKKFLNYTEKVFDAGYTKLVDKTFLDIKSMVKCAPQLIKLSAYRSVYSMVSKFIEDEHLRQAFSFHALLVGGNPFRCSSIYTLIHYLERHWGVHFPKGGTGALVQALLDLFKRHGGILHTSCPVQQITTHNDNVTGVRLENGVHLAANIVCSNADVVHTYAHLLKDNLLVKKSRNKALRSEHSMSLVVIYFGVSKKYPKQSHHQVIFGPRFKGLLDDVFSHGVLAQDFSLYLHAPTVSDPSLAPPGCETFYVLSPVAHLQKLPIDWKTTGPKYAEKILDFLDLYHLPGLKQNLEVLKIFTPADFQTEFNAHLGSAFSIEPTLLQSAYFRTHNKDPYLKGLYFVGAGTHPGAGIPGVLNSAKATINMIPKVPYEAQSPTKTTWQPPLDPGLTP